MEKRISIFFVIFGFIACRNIIGNAISVAVPKNCLQDKASLVLFMKDGFGNECIGSYQLDEKAADQMICQRDLKVEYERNFDYLFDSGECIDITHCAKSCDNQILVYFELDSDVHILRIIIIKDNIFADNPFDICCIPLVGMQQTGEEDEFEGLVNGDISPDIMRSGHLFVEQGIVSRYSLYLQLYFLMKYMQVKRKISEMFSWK